MGAALQDPSIFPCVVQHHRAVAGELLEAQGADERVLGVAVAVYSLGEMVGSAVFGKLMTKRLGARRRAPALFVRDDGLWRRGRSSTSSRTTSASLLIESLGAVGRRLCGINRASGDRWRGGDAVPARTRSEILISTRSSWSEDGRHLDGRQNGRRARTSASPRARTA